MANILLVDPDALAARALRGIVARGDHRLAAVTDVPAAREFIHHNVLVDLVIMELQLEHGSNGLTLLQEFRNDSLLRAVPVVVYTAGGDRETVKQALTAGVQNFLKKPYQDTQVFAEIAKALAKPWRDGLWVDESVLASRQKVDLAEVRQGRETFLENLERALTRLRAAAEHQMAEGLIESLSELAEAGMNVGASAAVIFLERLETLIEERKWPEALRELARLEQAHLWLHCGDRVERVPEGFATEAERKVEEALREKARWIHASDTEQVPVVTFEQLLHDVEALGGCPVMDAVAASFQMAATGHPSSLSPLMDLAEKDPGLSAQLLIDTNHARRQGVVEDPVDSARLCVGLLGETKLSSLARGLLTTEVGLMDQPPFSWSQYWMFQLGVAQLARHTCTYLEFESMEVRAFTGGLLHDLGRLLLFHRHPGGAQAILHYAQQLHVPLRLAEKRFLGGTVREVGAHFAQLHGLPEAYINVMRYVDAPAEAPADQELVAVVSLARDLCLHNRVGCSGEPATDHAVPLDETPQWAILRSRIFPSFNLRKFEVHIHGMCRDLKRELSGRSA